jgi:WD40 repeat protein
MKKQVILTIIEGNFEKGFSIHLEIREDEHPFKLLFADIGRLPSTLDLNLLESLRKWQSDFKNWVDPQQSAVSASRSRIKIEGKGAIKFNDESARDLVLELNQWLSYDQPLWKKILNGLQPHLNQHDEIRVIIKSDDQDLRRLPWSAWHLFSEIYENSEIALSTQTVKLPSLQHPARRNSQVRILAVFGKSDNINIKFDRKVLESLSDRGAEVNPLDQPKKEELLKCLRDEKGWDIFFFAGHSSTLPNGEIGKFDLNDSESLEIDDLKNAMKSAIVQGLQLAIFNSCDGLGLANQLAKLYLPQSIVMREVIPDDAAQTFLLDFITEFANNNSLYSAVRSARLNLEDTHNKKFPGISWLPIICQNIAVEPPTWKGFLPPPKWKRDRVLSAHQDIVKVVAISPKGNIMASGSLDTTIKLWNLQTGELLHTLTGHSTAIISLAFSPDGNTLASASNMELLNGGTIKLWNVNTGNLLETLGSSPISLRTSCLAFSPDGQTLASGQIGVTVASSIINLWNLATNKIRSKLTGHGWEVNSLAFSTDGQILVSGAMDCSIKVWNWHREKLLYTLNRPESDDWVASMVSWFDSSVGMILCVAISPDNLTIASCGSDQPIKLWNAQTGKEVRTLTDHTDTVYSLSFSPDGKTLASGSADNTIKIWNFHTGELLQTLEHLGPVKSVAFSSVDAKTLVSGSADNTIKIWRLSP